VYNLSAIHRRPQHSTDLPHLRGCHVVARLILSCLGSFRITLDGRSASGFESSKVRALLAYLAVESDRPRSRDALAGLLWPDQPEKSAHAALSQALANLRRTIDDTRAQPPFLIISRDSIQFNAESDHALDAVEFIALLKECRQHVHRHPETCRSCVERLQAAVDLYRGDLLEDFSPRGSTGFDEWALMKRERLRRLALEALFALAEYHDRHQSYEQAYQLAVRQIEFDPWREEAYRQAMRALVLKGERSAALEQYHTARLVLKRDLGIAPTVETTALYEQIRDESLAANRAQPSGDHTGLPMFTSRFVGRDVELADLTDRLENPDCRLLTLTGPGGIGKTRLAVEAVTRCADSFAHGVRFAPVTGLSSVERLVSAIADAVNLAFNSSTKPTIQLLNHLREKDMLLVLDGFEHLVPVAGLLADIIRQAPKVVLFVTSRERLGLQEEWVFDVQGLPYPRDKSLDALESYSAVSLFVQRARRVRVGFSLSPGNALYVIRICQLVEGMPLAIELAAEQLPTFSCRDIAHEIERNLSFLAVEQHDMTLRHRSMRVVFDRSWDLLSTEEKSVLQQLSAFRGGFSKKAAERRAGASASLLAALVDKSLVRRSSAGRYGMYELIRRYAGERLQEGTDPERLLSVKLDYTAGLLAAESAGPF